MRLYFNLDTDRTIRVQDMDATEPNTWSVAQTGTEAQQIVELAADLGTMGATETGYSFSSDLDFPTEYGFTGADDAHRIVASALTIAVAGI